MVKPRALRPSRRSPTHQVVWSKRALDDLDGVHAFLASVAPAPADDLKRRIVEAAYSLSFLPQRNTEQDGIYSQRIPKHHVIFYAIEGKVVVILQVVDGRRG